MTSVLGVALLGLALLARTTVAFVPGFGQNGTFSHVAIIREALMLQVTEACRAVAEAAGHEFQPTGSSPDELVQACMGSTATGLVSGAKFHSALQEIYLQNALVDCDLANSEPHHFHSEAFREGVDLILQSIAAIKANVRNENFQAARETLGRVLHTLQDFFSHSNWVDLGDTETYISLSKCSVAVHNTAVHLATIASIQLLEDIRLAAGDKDFLRMMGIGRSSVVCFVIDTTGSMGDDIAVAKEAVNELIDSKTGTQDEPTEYILVPFNDPDFGPAIRTSDPDEMKKEISKLNPSGGGDSPEMCLSGLHLALTTAPPSSYIYVFTDAEAKDTELKNTIMALIMETKSTVTFFMTKFNLRRRRSLTAAINADYQDIALASGGYVIDLYKNQLSMATGIVSDTTTSALVTILQRVGKPGVQETFTFMLDESLQNITIYIIASGIHFSLTNPAGVSQNNTGADAKLGIIQTVGNLRRIRLNAAHQTGTWKINMKSEQPYTVKVTGQSMITFIYNFVEKFEGPHPGYAILSGRPKSGKPVNLLLSVGAKKGPSSITVEYIGLVTVSGTEVLSKNSMTDPCSGDILVTVDAVPDVKFLVILKGKDKEANSDFERQSTTLTSVSKVNIQAVVTSSARPGEAFEIPFSVMTQGSGGQYSIVATNDRYFPMSFPSSLSLTTGKYTNDTLTITPPASTPSGTVVTVMMEAKSSSGVDSNSVILRLSVVAKITDFIQPLCEVERVLADNCPQDVSQCGPFQWELSANLTDGNGTGIERISLRQGNGTLSYTSLESTTIQATYNASCCSQIVEFIAVDEDGNVGKCYHSIVRSGNMSISKVDIQAVVASSVRPGEALEIPFSVMTQGSGGQYSIVAKNDKDFPMSFPSSLSLTTGKYTNDTLTITPPASTPSGTDVTVTMEAKSSSGVDSNSVVLKLSVVTKIPDFAQPLCEVVRVLADDCPQDVSQCGPFQWELSANLTDGNGTGIESISLRQGNGTLSYTSLEATTIQATYNASCCSQIVEFTAVDGNGKEGKCYHSIVRSGSTPALMLSQSLWWCLLLILPVLILLMIIMKKNVRKLFVCSSDDNLELTEL